jgi:hypothetical protein
LRQCAGSEVGRRQTTGFDRSARKIKESVF